MRAGLWKLRQLKVKMVTTVDLWRRIDEKTKGFHLIKSSDLKRNHFRSIKTKAAHLPHKIYK